MTTRMSRRSGLMGKVRQMQLEAPAPPFDGRLRASLLLALLATLLVATTATAGDIPWQEKTLRDRSGASLEDGDLSDRYIAAAWREQGDVYVQASTNAGDSFTSRGLVATDARYAATDICGDELWVTYAKTYGDDRLIDLTWRDVGAVGFSDVPVSFGDGRARDPDIACTDGRVFVSWLERVGGVHRIRVSDALRSRPVFADPALELGASYPFRGEPAFAGDGLSRRVFLVTQHGTESEYGEVKVTRFTTGGPPDFQDAGVTGHVLAQRGSYPQVALSGRKVVAAWASGCGALKVRVSDDRGGTWGATRTLVDQECNIADIGFKVPISVAINGQRIIVTYPDDCGDFASPPCATHRMVSTTDDFATWNDKQLIHEDAYASFVTGFVSVGDVGRVRLAMLEGEDNRYIRFLRRR